MPTPPSDQDIPISRAIGRFFGHLAAAVRPHSPAKPSAPSPAPDPGHTRRVSERTETETRDLDGQRVILRRTTIEEIELPGPESPGN